MISLARWCPGLFQVELKALIAAWLSDPKAKVVLPRFSVLMRSHFITSYLERSLVNP